MEETEPARRRPHPQGRNAEKDGRDAVFWSAALARNGKARGKNCGKRSAGRCGYEATGRLASIMTRQRWMCGKRMETLATEVHEIPLRPSTVYSFLVRSSGRRHSVRERPGKATFGRSRGRLPSSSARTVTTGAFYHFPLLGCPQNCPAGPAKNRCLSNDPVMGRQVKRSSPAHDVSTTGQASLPLDRARVSLHEHRPKASCVTSDTSSTEGAWIS